MTQISDAIDAVDAIELLERDHDEIRRLLDALGTVQVGAVQPDLATRAARRSNGW